MATIPDRAVLESMAAQTDTMRRWGKTIAEFDAVELKALLWLLATKRLDALTERLGPQVQQIERIVREIETIGYGVKIERRRTPEGLVLLTTTVYDRETLEP